MKIYIVHVDAWEDNRDFHELTNQKIEEMYDAGSDFVDQYESAEDLAANWNTDEIFYPNMSYMRVVNE